MLDIGIQAGAGLQHVHALRVDGRSADLVHRDVWSCCLARVDLDEGRVEAAARGIAEASAIAEALGVGPDSPLGGLLAGVRAALATA